MSILYIGASDCTAHGTSPELDSSCSSRFPMHPDRSVPLRNVEACQLRLIHALQALSSSLCVRAVCARGSTGVLQPHRRLARAGCKPHAVSKREGIDSQSNFLKEYFLFMDI